MTTRWFVEVSPVDADTLKERYCVEALQWQQALQQARKLRGDHGALSRFAIELLDSGYRATDPMAKLRYLVSKAPGDAPLSAVAASNGASAVTAAAAAAPPQASAVPRPAGSLSMPQPAARSAHAEPPRRAHSGATAIAATAAVAPVASAAPTPAAASVPQPAAPPTPAVSVPQPVAPPKPAASVAQPAAPPKPAAPVVQPAAPPKPAAPVAQPAAPPAPVAEVAPVPSPAEDSTEAIPSLPGLELISHRKEEPSASSPIVYREYAFAVSPHLTPKEVDRYIRAAWEQVRTALSRRTTGKFVQIAVFDHHFAGRPERPPLGVLAWKDWRGDPVVQVRGAAPAASAAATGPDASHAPPTSPAVAGAVPAAVAPASPAVVVPTAAVAAAPAIVAPGASEPTSTAVAASVPVDPARVATEAPRLVLVPSADPAPAAPVVAQAPMVSAGSFPMAAAAPSVKASLPPGARQSVRPPANAVRRRTVNEDLIGELFEEMHQVHFMPDVVTGAEYVLNVLSRVMPCEGVLVHVFDINTRQFVVVRALGPNARSVLLHRTPDTYSLFREAFRRARAVHFPVATGVESYQGGRIALLGLEVKTAVCGPVKQGGRYLGILELLNPQGGTPFHEGEMNAIDYICEQFADFVASRPIVLDEDAVIPRT